MKRAVQAFVAVAFLVFAVLALFVGRPGREAENRIDLSPRTAAPAAAREEATLRNVTKKPIVYTIMPGPYARVPQDEDPGGRRGRQDRRGPPGRDLVRQRPAHDDLSRPSGEALFLPLRRDERHQGLSRLPRPGGCRRPGPLRPHASGGRRADARSRRRRSRRRRLRPRLRRRPDGHRRGQDPRLRAPSASSSTPRSSRSARPPRSGKGSRGSSASCAWTPPKPA